MAASRQHKCAVKRPGLASQFDIRQNIEYKTNQIRNELGYREIVSEEEGCLGHCKPGQNDPRVSSARHAGGTVADYDAGKNKGPRQFAGLCVNSKIMRSQ